MKFQQAERRDLLKFFEYLPNVPEGHKKIGPYYQMLVHRLDDLTMEQIMMNQRVPFVLSREEVRSLDRRAIEDFGVPSVVLMENAGRGVAELVMRLNSARQMVTIVCGPGNNGGDGFVIARHLDNMNILASVWCVAPLAPPAKEPDPMWRDVRVSPDSRVNLEILLRSRFSVEFIEDNGLPLPEARREQLSKHLQSREGWIVDAIFGTGLNRAPTSPFRDIIELLNHAGRPILAVDLPSGLDCDSGESLGTTIHASHTGTFVALKKGFLNESAKPFLGEVHVLSIGAPRTLIEEFLR